MCLLVVQTYEDVYKRQGKWESVFNLIWPTLLLKNNKYIYYFVSVYVCACTRAFVCVCWQYFLSELQIFLPTTNLLSVEYVKKYNITTNPITCLPL